LRFIEQMPLDAGHIWAKASMITAAEILKQPERALHLTAATSRRGSAPAEQWFIDGGPHTVGIIASVTRPFCADCDRVRLTADGQLRSCLFASRETDLRPLLRGGEHGRPATDTDIAERWRATLWAKKAGHGINEEASAFPTVP